MDGAVPTLRRTGDTTGPATDCTTPRASAASRLDRLRLKLFLAIAGANALVALVAYLVFSWSFDRGVVESLQRRDAARLEAFAASLADDYDRSGGWNFLDGERWAAASRSALGLPPLARRQGFGKGGSGNRQFGNASLREPPPTVDPRLMLFDADRRLMFGPPELATSATLRPITQRERVVGYLGHVERTGLAESFERVMTAQQHWLFAGIALGMLAAALVLGAGLAHWLTRRIHRVGRGAAQLAEGDYTVRIEARGHDEIDRLARDFNDLAGTLEANRRARQQWVADIAHELRTPLAVLRGEIEALQDGVRAFDAATLVSLAQEVARLGRLVEDLHLLSQTDIGALTYYKEKLDLGELVAEVIEANRRAFDEQRITIDFECECEIEVLADATRLSQVLGNLMQNTLRYTDSPGRLRVRVRANGGRAHIEWQDSSPGVAAEHLPRLTDRLYRVDRARERGAGSHGAGLGLAIARAIVEAHGGSMTPAPSPLGGLEWNVSLPLAEGPIGAAPRPPAP